MPTVIHAFVPRFWLFLVFLLLVSKSLVVSTLDPFLQPHCCPVNATQLWRKDEPANSALSPFYNYSFLVPEVQLQAGISYYGSALRLRRFVTDLIAGKRHLKVGVVGGSISLGRFAQDIGRDDWFSLVSSWLAGVMKAPISFKNGCVAGTPSSYMILCMEYSLDPDVDLVFVEYTVNDGPTNYVYGNHVVKSLERLYRRILDLPSRPAVVSVQLPLHDPPDRGFMPFYYTSEHLQGALSNYYDLPTVSMNTVIRHLEELYPEDFQYSRMYITNHPGNTGHKIIADLVVHLIQLTVRDVMVRPISEAERTHLGRPILRPIYEGNLPPSAPSCLIEERFWHAIAESHGWDWVDEGNAIAHKWGMVSRQPGASLVLRMNTQRDQLASNTTIPLYLLFLVSYKDMGRAVFECVSGCHCDPLEVDASISLPVSQTHTDVLNVTMAAECLVRVRLLNETSSGGHKFKMSGFIITESAETAKLIGAPYEGFHRAKETYDGIREILKLRYEACIKGNMQNCEKLPL